MAIAGFFYTRGSLNLKQFIHPRGKYLIYNEKKCQKLVLLFKKKKCCHRLRVTAVLTELGYLKKVNTDKMQHSDKISFPR